MGASASIQDFVGQDAISVFSDQQIRRVAEEPAVTIASWVQSTALERGVAVRSMPTDTFARAASRLSDAQVDLDPVEEMLIALRQAGVISAFQRGLLQVNYLR
jgi:hypothetical protein